MKKKRLKNDSYQITLTKNVNVLNFWQLLALQHQSDESRHSYPTVFSDNRFYHKRQFGFYFTASCPKKSLPQLGYVGTIVGYLNTKGGMTGSGIRLREYIF